MELSKVERDIAINPLNNNNSYNNPSSSTTPSPTPNPGPGVESTILSSPLKTLDPLHKPTSTSSPNPKSEMIRYRECQRNHAAHLGGHVVDGCGEFMPSGEEGTPLALKCAACECHRNFHRREIEGETSTTATTAPPTLLPPPALPPPTTANCYISFNSPKLQKHLSVRPFGGGGGIGPTLAHHHHNRAPVLMTFGGGAAAESSSDDLNAYREVAAGQFGDQYGSSKKRFRTKFTQEQKDKMMEFADKIGWRIQKQDDAQVQQFCAEVGVKRQVFKVWLHNNKQAIKRKQS